MDNERLLDFLDNDRLRDFFDRDLLLDFFDKERLLDRFDSDLVLLLDLDFSGECDRDFFERDGDLDAECFDSEDDLDLDNLLVLAGDLGDFLGLGGDAEDLCLLGDADFLLLDTEREFFSLEADLDRRLGDLEDLFSIDTDLVYDLEGDLEADLSLGECFLETGEFFFEVLCFALLVSIGGGGDSLGERNFILSLRVTGGERDGDLLCVCFLGITGEFFLEVFGGDFER